MARIVRVDRWSASGALLLLLVGAGASPAEAVARRVFATSISGTGNLTSWPVGSGSGLARGDSICETLAFNAGLPNPGLYKAWLSNATTDAFCHLFGYSGKRSDDCGGELEASDDLGPWVLANGITTFGGSLRAMVDENAVLLPVLFDENADWTGDFFASTVWTGTWYEGEHGGASCNSWVSGASDVNGIWGSAVATTVHWTSYNPGACNNSRRLICFEAAVGNPAIEPYWSPGRIAFLTSATGNANLLSWPEAAGASGPGLAAADQICRTLAAEASLPAPESFLAWISSASVQPPDRLPATGPYRRLDGFIVGNDLADLVDGDNDAPIHLLENGQRSVSVPSVWTGTTGTGTTGGTCAEWTDGVNGAGTAGLYSVGYSHEWTQHLSQGCSSNGHLYCLSTALTIFWDGFEITGDASRWSSVSP